VTESGFVIADRAAVLPDADALVLADLHLGRDSTSAVELPMGERADVLDRIATLLDEYEPATVVLAGDVLHSFATVPPDVPATVGGLEGMVHDAGADLRVLAGNHDTMLASLVGGPVEGARRLSDGTVVVHGHDVPALAADRYVVGHEHPAIVIEGARRPCALDCDDQYRGASVLVLPAFSRFAKGTTVNSMDRDGAMSPLVTDVDRCRPIVIAADSAVTFPPLGEFRSLL